MTYYIGHATRDYDHKAGDSSGNEVKKSKFTYSTSSTSPYNWTYVFRPKDSAKAEKAAAMAEKGIANNAIGYNSNGSTAYGKDKNPNKLAAAVGYDLSKIKIKCGCCCGDFVCLCNHYAGLTTCYIGSGLGLSKYLKDDKNFETLNYKKGMKLYRGDVLITAHSNGKNNHVAMVLVGEKREDVKPTMKKLCDISNYQGVVAESTFKSMKKNGMDMVVIRCSYTHRNNPFSMDKDKSFEKNIVNAYKAGMKIGVYHYSQAISTKEAITEAEYALSIIKRHKSKITLPVVFDCEFGIRFNATRAKGIGKTGMLDICNFFCKTVEKAGFKSMVYANLKTLNNYISAQLPEQRRVWVAQYPYAYKEVNDVPVSKLDYKKPYYMWQFTSSGRVQGVGGHVDLSYLKGDEPKPHTPTTYKGTFPTLPKRGWFQKGDKGVQVKNLQKLLVWLGYSVGSAGVDGEYGKATASAVLQFEKDYKLKYKDGEWGKECNAKAKTIKK